MAITTGASAPGLGAAGRPGAARRLRSRISAPSVGFALGLLILDVLVAGSLTVPRLALFLLAVIAALLAAATFRFPFAATCVLLALTDSIFHVAYFATSAGPVSLRLEEVAFVAVLAVALLRPVSAWWGGFSGGALALFGGVVLFAAYAGLAAGRMPLSDAFNWSRPYLFLGTFFIVVRLFPHPLQLRRLLTAACVLAALTGLAGLAVVAHPALGDYLQGEGQQEIRPFGSLTRVHLPGLSFAYLLFWWAVLELVQARGGRRLGFAAIVLGMVVNIALSFNRNMWLGLVIGLVLLLVVVTLRARKRLAGALAVTAGGVVLLVGALGSLGPSSTVDPLIERATTLANPQGVSQESSLTSRGEETRLAWIAAKAHPVTGVGPGASFGVYYNQAVGNGRYVRVEQGFLHNQYLYLVLLGGLPAFVTFLTFMGSVLARARFGGATFTPLTVLGVGLAMLMISAVVMPYFSVAEMTAAIGVVTGAMVAWDRSLRAPAVT